MDAMKRRISLLLLPVNTLMTFSINFQLMHSCNLSIAGPGVNYRLHVIYYSCQGCTDTILWIGIGVCTDLIKQIGYQP